MNACLSNWIYALNDNGDQGLNADWMPNKWLPVGGNTDEQRQSMLVYLTVKKINSSRVGYVAPQDRKFSLSIATKEMSQYKLITNEFGRVTILDNGDVEIEWLLGIPKSILTNSVRRPLSVIMDCSGSPPRYGDFELRICERDKVSPDVNRWQQDDNFDLHRLDSAANNEMGKWEQILLDGLKSAVCKAFDIGEIGELDQYGILIDTRCGRFLMEAVANQSELAKVLIRQTIEVIIRDGWWYVSRPQIETAIKQLVSPSQNIGVNPLVDNYICQCFNKSSIISSGDPHKHAKLVLLEIWDLHNQDKQITILTIVNSSLRSKRDRFKREPVNIPGTLDELVKSGLLRESKGHYEFTNEFVKSWAERQALTYSDFDA